ncbi:HAMP domain-containing sensor histidine kinase [Thermotoga sp.]|uniref:sensor histidine kinase n=1 Tax=Thermotoga sp. TaxID=28240 RepID=UPI0025EC9D42|nr:HAMP domain-containing sensor histidine kinase [Thermotoga sp.]MCD6551461.1 HAMP domain-containing histidine kinase [Thermotoga sp.]
MLSVTNEKRAFRKTHLIWTLIFTLSIVFVVAAAAGAVFIVEKNRITRQFDGDLIKTAEFIERRLKAPGMMKMLRMMGGLNPIFVPRGEAFQFLFPSGEVFLEVGEQLDTPEVPVKEGFSTEGNYRVFTKRIDLGDTVIFLRVGRDISDLMERSRRLLSMYLLLLVLTAGSAWIFGYFISRLALLPVRNAYDSLKRFSMDASHELKTPLSVLKTSLDVLKYQENVPDEVKNKLSIMEKNVEKMKKQVEQLLLLVRSGETFKNAVKERINLREFLGEIVEAFVPRAEAKGLKLKIECPDSLFVEVEKDVLRVVLENLIDNAIKFTEKGEVIVGAHDDGRLTIYVKDTGPGIPKREQKKIFERFYRLSRNTEGSGLGLSIVKELATRLKAKIILESEEGKGSTFKLIL